jgi:hypothetical protein
VKRLRIDLSEDEAKWIAVIAEWAIREGKTKAPHIAREIARKMRLGLADKPVTGPAMGPLPPMPTDKDGGSLFDDPGWNEYDEDEDDDDDD